MALVKGSLKNDAYLRSSQSDLIENAGFSPKSVIMAQLL